VKSFLIDDMVEKYQIIVPANKGKERIDKFLAREIKNVSRSKIKKLIKTGRVLVNSEPTKNSYLISPHEEIEVTIPVERSEDIEPENIPLEILYDDKDLVVINKKPGMVVHPACGNFSGTLVNALLYHFNNLSEIAGELKPGIVHRLDKDTSGVLVVAKNNSSHWKLSQQFSEREIEKIYWAVIWGQLKRREGTIEKSIGRSTQDRKKMVVVEDKGKLGITHYKVLEEFELFSLVEVRPKTGRTHQIRSHFAHLGHPVFGDDTYGGRNIKLSHYTTHERTFAAGLLSIMPRQALHAKSIGFLHPETKQFIRIEAPLPDDFSLLLESLREDINPKNADVKEH